MSDFASARKASAERGSRMREYITTCDSAREAAQVRQLDERTDGIEIEYFHFKRKWKKSRLISVHYGRRDVF